MKLTTKQRRIFFLLLGAGLFLLGLKYLLPLVLPFLLGIGTAAALTPLIRLLQRRFSLRRGVSAALTVTGILGAMILLLWLLTRLLMRQIAGLYDRLPELLASASQGLTAFGAWAERLSELLPGGVGDAFSDWAAEIVRSGGTLASSLYERLFSLVYDFLGKLPDTLLFLLTTILSCYFSAAELPRLRAICREHLPARLLNYGRKLSASMKTVLTGWVRAQLILMGITFLILLCGLWILGVSFPLLPALMIALLDALPLFGTGTVLLPWGLLRLISGDFHLGLGLMVLYAAAALSRNVLEPRLLGAQVGVSPLLTLFAIYMGYRLSGFTGMILLPIGVMVAFELWAAGHPASLSSQTQPQANPASGFSPHISP